MLCNKISQDIKNSSLNLLLNLFAAYLADIDPVFKAYMTNHPDTYGESKVNFTMDKLMEVVVNKYKILLESETWNAPSAHVSQIIALTGEINVLKERVKDNTL